ncbi:MAG TPA: carbamoyltransferase C-terminal domain-containing protein, partial [Verrucomicrobiae bacterium]
APCVLREEVNQYFDLQGESPYMLLVAQVRPELHCALTAEQQRLMRDPDLRKRVNVRRSSLPAITHVDMSARVQTVDPERHGRFYRLMQEFKRQTGCGVLINTSFNIRGEPIVCTPQDACRCFLATDMDMLVLEDCLLYKQEQAKTASTAKRDYLESFALD